MKEEKEKPDQNWNPFVQITHTRREFLLNISMAGAGWMTPPAGSALDVDLVVNGKKVHVDVDPRGI